MTKEFIQDVFKQHTPSDYSMAHIEHLGGEMFN